MTSAELTTFLNENAEDAAEQKTLANIARRASTLWEDGYTVKRIASMLFWVATPKGGGYMVETENVFAAANCSCPCFVKRSTCKHLLAVLAMLWEEEQAQEAALLAEAEAAEVSRAFYADAAETYYHRAA